MEPTPPNPEEVVMTYDELRAIPVGVLLEQIDQVGDNCTIMAFEPPREAPEDYVAIVVLKGRRGKVYADTLHARSLADHDRDEELAEREAKRALREMAREGRS